jgi:RES domain-containing protein
MVVYRIAKSEERAKDLSGFGSLKFGGRWNSKGTNMLYTSMNSSLALLENLVHFEESNLPPNLYLTTLEIKDADKLIYELPDDKYPAKWQVLDNLENKLIGDKWVLENKFLAFKVRSAINPSEYNFLLNPRFPGYYETVKISSIKPISLDARLLK